MIDTYSRHRPLALLAIVVVAQVMLLAFQVKGEHDVRLIRYWAVALVTPLERAGTWSFSKVGGAWGGYVGLRNARAENDHMRIELDQLRLRNRELESQAAQAQRLSTVLNFRNAHAEASMLAAQVIGVNSFALPGEPSGVDREIIGQLPSGFCVATRKSIPRLISGRSAV